MYIIFIKKLGSSFVLNAERGFEDHEYLVEPLSAWTRDSKNKIIFLLRPNKYLFFKDPQVSTVDNRAPNIKHQTEENRLNQGEITWTFPPPKNIYFFCCKAL